MACTTCRKVGRGPKKYRYEVVNNTDGVYGERETVDEARLLQRDAQRATGRAFLVRTKRVATPVE